MRLIESVEQSNRFAICCFRKGTVQSSNWASKTPDHAPAIFNFVVIEVVLCYRVGVIENDDVVWGLLKMKLENLTYVSRWLYECRIGNWIGVLEDF
ncbi:hypothetical protein Hanom_Chr00s197425g01837081 [Helianthus anomalus]